MFQHIRDILKVRNTLEIFAKLVKPRAKSWVKLRITVKMQGEIVPKENNKGKNSNFFLNPKELEFLSISFVLHMSTYVPT